MPPIWHPLFKNFRRSDIEACGTSERTSSIGFEPSGAACEPPHHSEQSQRAQPLFSKHKKPSLAIASFRDIGIHETEECANCRAFLRLHSSSWRMRKRRMKRSTPGTPEAWDLAAPGTPETCNLAAPGTPETWNSARRGGSDNSWHA